MQILLNKLRFHAFHGCLPQERSVGNDYTLNLTLTLPDNPLATVNDELQGTVNYADVYALAVEVMNEPANLLEHVAHTLATRLLAAFPAVERVRVELCKLAPPMPSDMAAACVVVEQAREISEPNAPNATRPTTAEQASIADIAERLHGLREGVELSVEEMAQACGLPLAAYAKMESGEADISIASLQRIAKRFKLSMNELLFGEDAHIRSYFLTRKGEGSSVSRTKAYQYESLAAGFNGRKAEPFMVTIEPRDDDAMPAPNTHEGEEFQLIMEGSMELHLGEKRFVLNEGDSFYFNSQQPHAMRALYGKRVKFLAIIL